MRIMITGGGTGGHTSPALAIVEELRRRDPQLFVQWVGRTGGFEAGVCAAHGIPFRGLPVEGWPRARTWRRLWVAMKLAVSAVRAWLLLRAFRPQAVIGVGGYVCLPLMWAAQRMNIPTVLHEQNKRLGMANRLLAPKASRVFLSYEDTIGTFPAERATVTGNPVRAAFAMPPDRETACALFDFDPAIPVVLVCGGSQGAQSLNQAMEGVAQRFQKGEAQFLWMTGKNGFNAGRACAESAAARVEAVRFIDDMAAACAAADLIVSRAGASTTAELAVIGKPSLLIPYPHATDNHQEQNARAFETAGAAEVLLDRDCTGETLAARIRALLGDRPRMHAMAEAARRLAKPAAADTIAEGIMALVFQG